MNTRMVDLRRIGLQALIAALAASSLALPMGGIARAQDARIAAVVNGTVITNQDVDARARLFALSAGLPLSANTLSRLKPQIVNQLIDQTLQLQAIEKNHVVVTQKQIAAAVERINKANGLPPNGLQQRLAKAGIPFSTLISQFRTQIGWNGVLKKHLGENFRPTKQDVLAERAAMRKEIGQTQYHIAEIFVPIDRPRDAASARKFADTVIKQLRNGAAFPVVAAQFSQSESALTGGDKGWVAPDLLDPAVRAIVERMPTGAISDPVRVPGGYEIVSLLGTRKFGEVPTTILHVNQVFLKFPTPFNGGQPDAGQIAVLNRAGALRGTLHDCAAVAAANQAAGSVRPTSPGPVDLSTVQPAAFQQLLGSLPIGQASQPLVSHNGVALVMVCSRVQKTTGLPGLNRIGSDLIQRRVSLESRQLMDTLHREAIITRSAGA